MPLTRVEDLLAAIEANNEMIERLELRMAEFEEKYLLARDRFRRARCARSGSGSSPERAQFFQRG